MIKMYGNYYGNYYQPQQWTPPVDSRVWVPSEAAAESYLVANNSTVHLWDSRQPVIYEKTTDINGRPLPLVIYDYVRRGDQSPMPEDRLTALEQRIAALEAKEAPNEQ